MTTYTDSHPTARVKHRCDLCHRTIRPGEKYRRGAGLDCGTAWTWKECGHCELLLDWLCRLGVDWWADGYNDEMVADWEPDTVAGLRLKANWRRRWTQRDGSLTPLPVATYTTNEHGSRRLSALAMPARQHTNQKEN